MIERVVENWLTNTNERQYQFAFSQLLISKGYRVLHMSSHGPQEQGKDIITLDPNDRPAGFQLKTGNLDLKAYRKIHDEIVELVELPINFPGVSTAKQHRAILVTNGRLTDTVRSAINGYNQKWLQRNFGELEVITLDELLKEFIDLHGRFLPTQPKDVEPLLRLFTLDGSSPLPRAQFSEFVFKNLPFEGIVTKRKTQASEQKGKSKRISEKDVERQLASTTLLVSYALSAFEGRNNHWSLFEGWVMFGAHVIAVAEAYDLKEKFWINTFNIIFHAARHSLTSLIGEAISNNDLLEGDVLVDSHLRRARITILLGMIATNHLICRINGEVNDFEDQSKAFVKAHCRNLHLWGETSVPYLLLLGLYVELIEGSTPAEALWDKVLSTITTQNCRKTEGENREGLSDPYLEIEDALAHNMGFNEAPEWERAEYAGQAYTIRALVMMLARRFRRQLLSANWYRITGLDFIEMYPSPPWEILLWRSKGGHLKISVPKRPQSWLALHDEAQTKDFSAIPNRLLSRPDFMLAWLSVYPHRLRTDVIRAIELGVWGS